MHGSRGGGTRGPHPALLKNHKAIRFLSNTGTDSLETHKATKLAFILGLPAKRCSNQTAFCWQTDDGPLLVVFGSSLPSSTKNHQSGTLSDKTFRICAWSSPFIFQISPYPTAEVLQENLRTRVNWMEYRKVTLRNLIKTQRDGKPPKHKPKDLRPVFK